MNGGSVFVFFLVGIGLVVVVAILGYHAKKRRREGFALMARQLGLRYASDDPFLTLGEPFRLFGRGDGRGVENVLWGTWQGVELRAFDYWYYEESTNSEGGTSKSYTRFNCVLLDVNAACSPLTIDPENMLTLLADALSFRDIEFESDEFNRAFNVKSADRKFANDLIDARMMRWLLDSTRGYSFEVVGNRLLCFRRRLAPVELVPLLGTAKGFRDHVPPVVCSLYPLDAAG